MGHCCTPIKIPKVANFHINHTDSQLEVVLTNGQTFSVSKAELEEFLGGNGVTVEDGVAKNLTLKGGVALDQAATASLCEALEDCIEDAITEALKNQPTPKPLTIKSFELLGEQLRITMPDGSTFPVDLSKFTTDAEAAKIADDIKKLITDEHLVSAALNGGTLVMTMKSGKQLNVPLSGLGKDVHLSSGTVQGNNLVLTKSDGTEVTIDLGQFANTQPAVGQDIVNNLTDTSASKSLSAAQGKILNDSKLGKTEKAVSASTADAATKLQTARTINGVAFDGTQNIVIADDTKLPSGANAVSATKLQTARTINGVAFDGTQNITINTALKAVQRTERTGTLIPTNNSFKNLTVDVAGVVEVYPDGRIVQSFSFVAPVRYFHRHSAQAFYRTTLGVANFTAGEDSPILEMPLWTAMPNKVSEARVHLSSGPKYHAYSEANEWIYDWDAIFNQQANIKDKAYFSFRRLAGGTDEPVTFNIVVEGY